MVPMRGADGTLLGVVSVDEPESGLRPTDEELDVLVAFAEHVAAALEAAQDVAAAARDRAALAQLLEVSASLVDLESVDSVLAAVAHGIQDALEFEKVAVCLATAEGGMSPPAPPGGCPDAPELDFRISTVPISTRSSPRSSRPKGAGWSITRRASALVGQRLAVPLAAQRPWAAAPGTVTG